MAAGAVVVMVEVGAVCSAGFGASCFWHPAKAKTVAMAKMVMIAEIFFMMFHPLSSRKIIAVRF